MVGIFLAFSENQSENSISIRTKDRGDYYKNQL